MTNLKIDSPVSRRIVLAFLDFLNSVEPTPGSELEGLEVVRDCLEDVFKLNSSSNEQIESGLLVKYFNSLDSDKQRDSGLSIAENLSDAPSSSSTRDVDELPKHNPKRQDEGYSGEPHTSAVSTDDELIGQFFAALDEIHFLSTTNGDDDHGKIERAVSFFHEAVKELKRSGCKTINSSDLAETFKAQGNRAMQSKLYTDAIELYTYAIALCQSNAVYYCNRAAAFTQIQKYIEAISDCKRSIEIDPNYSKAYSRLGLAYYAQGNYRDAIDKGFTKALQLDPDNDSVKENIRVAEQKLRDPHGAENQNQRSTNHSNHESTNGQPRRGPNDHNIPPSFTNLPFNPADLSSNITNLIMNMVGQHSQGRADDDSHADGSEGEPEIRIGGNINLNVGEDVPEELMGTWRSVMGMFSGAQPHQNPEGDMPRGPTPN